jgi:HEAT repeat protein
MNLLIEALQAEYDGTRIWAARALGRLGGVALAAVPKLMVMLNHRRQRIRAAAADALERIQPEALRKSPNWERR